MGQVTSSLQGGLPQHQGRHWVIGTAGHVDHGKTTLVKALTGVDTDRLPEEKLREMTIDLGFARLELPSGRSASLVDVPGHERFIGNMLAGATGIDLVLFVVAADEGVMPQTVEHLDILRLLGLEAGIVVITKADLVEHDWLAIVRDDIAAAVAGTFLAGAPVVEVSAYTGQGLADLRQAIDTLLDGVRGKPVHGPARLPIDRVFTVAGFGTVVTGTMVSGAVAVGDQLELLPESRLVRVRTIQVHGAARERAVAGERVALNLAGLERAAVLRGEVLATPGRFLPTIRFDGLLNYTDRVQRNLRTRARVHLHVGTSEVVGRLLLLGGDEIAPGEEAFVQFHSESPLVVGPKDRFIIRSYSPRRTIGGGLIVDSDPAFRRSRPKGKRAAVLFDSLRLALRGDPADLVAAVLAASAGPLDQAEVMARAESEYGTALADVVGALATLVERGDVLVVGGADDRLYLAAASLALLGDRAKQYLSGYHVRYALRLGATRDEFRAAVAPDLAPKRYAVVVAALAGAGLIAVEGDRIRLPEFAVELTAGQRDVAERITAAYLQAGAAPPDLAEVAAAVVPGGAARGPGRFEDVHEYLASRGVLVRIREGLYFHRDVVARATSILLDHLAAHGSVSVSDFRQLIGTTRKYALPLLEYFDGLRLTRRQGDDRVPGSGFAAAKAGQQTPPADSGARDGSGGAEMA